MRIFLFPYCTDSVEGKDTKGYGIQSLMLPLYKCKHKEFMKSKFLEFILVLAYYKPQYLLKLTLPQFIKLIKPAETILVITREDEMKELTDEMKELKEQNEDFQEQFYYRAENVCKSYNRKANICENGYKNWKGINLSILYRITVYNSTM